MVRFVSPSNYDSSIGNAITQAAQTMFGPEKLKGALAQAQLEKAQRENASATDLAHAIYAWGNSAAQHPAAPAPASGGGHASAPAAPALPSSSVLPDGQYNPIVGPTKLRAGIINTAHALGMDPAHLATVIGYETRGTFDPTIKGPVTPQWGQMRGLLQFGQPQAQEYGVDWQHPVDSQLGPNGAVAQYFRAHGYKPGMGLEDIYSIVNAGHPGAYNATDAHNGGAPGTVAEKVHGQMQPYARLAQEVFGGGATPQDTAQPAPQPAAQSADAGPAPAYMPAAAPSPMTGAPDTRPGHYNPNNAAQNIAQLLATGVMSGQKPAAIADLIRAFSGNTYGAENQATTNAAVAAGEPYANTYSGFADSQNQKERQNVRTSENSRYATDTSAANQRYLDNQKLVTVLRNGVPVQVRKQDLQPTDRVILTDSQNKGLVAQGMHMTPAEKQAYVGATPKAPPQAHRYYSASEQRIIPSLDGIHGVDGQPLPGDAVQVSVVSPNMAGTGLTNSNKTKVESHILALDNFRTTLEGARKLAMDPTIFGISGKLQRFGMNTVQQWSQIKQNFPKQAKAIEEANHGMLATIMGAAKSNDPNGVFANFIANKYNPNLAGLDLYAQLLPYEAAAVFTGQTGRSVSDKDIKHWQDAVGDPTSLFSSQEKFVAHLNALDHFAQQEIYNAKHSLTNGVDAANNPQPTPEPGAAAPTHDAAPAVPTVESAAHMTAQDIANLQDPASLPPDVLDAVIARGKELGLK